MRQVPIIRKLFFDAKTSDYMTYKRRKITPLTDEELAARDYATQIKL